MNLLKKNFFELGVAFGQFSAKPVQDNYETICKTASPLELELPDYDNLKNQPFWDFSPPAKWFMGSDDVSLSLRNCYEIGILAYFRFLLALPPVPNTQTGQISEAEQKLRYLFEEENIALEVLDEYLKGLETDLSADINEVLRVFVRDFPKAFPSDNESTSERIFGDNIFIVHGHDGEAKNEVARFIENLKLTATILDEQPSRGQTIIDKFEEHADEAGFAIVLLTADDLGAPKDNNELKPRARQNVILELGYFLHGLGRERVCVLHKEGVELPSDIHGIVYVPFDETGGWMLRLSKELAALDIIPPTLPLL
ncbi:nucleotide-binding protein [Candidatus Poribacteria bacterium]|nr:nucleotide-binding protein [Candidatus Poribacteria bacterium]